MFVHLGLLSTLSARAGFKGRLLAFAARLSRAAEGTQTVPRRAGPRASVGLETESDRTGHKRSDGDLAGIDRCAPAFGATETLHREPRCCA